MKRLQGLFEQGFQTELTQIDSMLPIQSNLAKEFGVSRMTIKKAIEMLTIEGLVLSKQGNGTKV